MILLYFLLDACFYTLTPFKTEFLLHSFLDKKTSKIFFFLGLFIIDLLLHTNGKLILLYTLLFVLNSNLKLSYTHTKPIFFRFFILYLFYKLGILCLFHIFVFDAFGLSITLLFLYCVIKK